MIGDLSLFNMGSFLKLFESGMLSLCVYEKHSMIALQIWFKLGHWFSLSYTEPSMNIKLNVSLKD